MAVRTPHRRLGTTAPYVVYASQSMGAVGTSTDHDLAESFNDTLKREVLRDRNSLKIRLSDGRKPFDGACATTRAYDTPGATF